MALEGNGRIYEYQEGKVVIYVPARVHGDSAFPFRPGQPVRVRIDPRGNRLIIERAD
jgi:hypothetical protein